MSRRRPSQVVAVLCMLVPAVATDARLQVPAPARSCHTYVVRKGDSLWAIATRYGTTVAELYRLNRLSGSLIRVYQHLLVPATAPSQGDPPPQSTPVPSRQLWLYRLPDAARIRQLHKVVSGDTLSALALHYGTTVGLIQGANRLTSHLIRVGQSLTVPTPSDARAVSRSWPGSYDHNLWTLARVINAEARGESYEGQVAVGAVILNRLTDPGFPKTVEEVIKEPRAFTAVADGQFRMRPSDSALRAAKEALEGWDPTRGALYYYNPAQATAAWSLRRPTVKTIGRHVFTV